MKKVVVTGANGFLGTALCGELVHDGVEVFAIVKDESENISKIENLPGIKIVYCDLCDFRDLGRKIQDKDIDVFYHFAWSGSAGSLRGDAEVQISNIRYCCDAVKAASKLGCKKFVFASSVEIYGENKKDIELYLAEGDQANIIDDRRQ